MMKKEFSWQSNSSLNIYAQEWEPEIESRGSIALVHGLGEHINRYDHVANFFNRSGFGFVAFDLPGHGKSDGVRGHFKSYDDVMNNIDRLIEETKKRYPGKPCFLYGHSLGGNLVLYYALSRNPELAGVIATSPGLAADTPLPAWKTALGRIMYRIYPSFQMENGLDLDRLSRDPAIKAAYIADPLVHSKASARLGMDLFDHGQWILDNAEKFPLPLLLMQGSEDHLVNVKSTIALSKRVPNITFKMWEGSYHELHNEPNKAEVLDYMLNWINSRLG